MNLWTSSIVAMAAPGQGGQQQSSFFPLLMMIAMFAIMWFVLIRPQQRREKDRREMINQVKTGDRVIFAGGLIGIVTNAKDKTVTIKIADNVKVEAARYAISQVLGKGDMPETEAQK